jgi:hypothetical protein
MSTGDNVYYSLTLFSLYNIKMMWPFSAFMGTSKNMVTAKELKIGKRYKVPTHRGMGPCSKTTLGKWNKIRSNI